MSFWTEQRSLWEELAGRRELLQHTYMYTLASTHVYMHAHTHTGLIEPLVHESLAGKCSLHLPLLLLFLDLLRAEVPPCVLLALTTAKLCPQRAVSVMGMEMLASLTVVSSVALL